MENEQFVIGAIMAKDPGERSQEEQTILAEWLEHNGNQDIYNKAIDEEYRQKEISRLYELYQENDRCLQKFHASVGIIPMMAPGKKTIGLWRRWPRYLVAASVLSAVLVGGLYLYKVNNKKNSVADRMVEPTKTMQTDAAPGQFKAKLVLADGSAIVLDSAATGKLAQQGNATIVNEDGKLVYKNEGIPAEGQKTVLYNKLVTAKGETFSTVLSDGSKIWLNSESSISYPVSFAGEERKVTITGEAYFEVATAYLKGSKVKQPFKVAVDDMEIEVLGTHFNVNAYTDEDAIKTTLLEGKVKVTSGTMSATLTPGQQALLRSGAKLLAVKDNADVEEAVAWKNGYFQFSDDDLKTVMRQLSRWYDVEVIYKGGVGTDTYGGRINRNSKASEVLTLLGRNRVKYKIEGKKIIITP